MSSSLKRENTTLQAPTATLPSLYDLVQSRGYHSWRPRTRSAPAVCTMSVFSADLLGEPSYGLQTLNLNLNWALHHGYTFSAFLGDRLSPPPLVWAKPRAMTLLLQKGPDECAWVFSLDADAVVTAHRSSIGRLVAAYAPSQWPPPAMYMACHKPSGDRGVCGQCRCSDARACSGLDAIAEATNDSTRECGANTGVVLVRNSAQAREMVAWWASAGRGLCPWAVHGGQPEQQCAWLMRSFFPGALHLLAGETMNAPAYLTAVVRAMRVTPGGRDTREITHGLVVPPDHQPTRWARLSLQKQLGCLDERQAFVCHPYGWLGSRSSGHVMQLKVEALRRALERLNERRKSEDGFVDECALDVCVKPVVRALLAPTQSSAAAAA